jgi:glucosamine 6-phosphate synthetase-like amidotransferase/phosphosugar isomerase protein
VDNKDKEKKFSEKIQKLSKEEIDRSIEDSILLADHSNLYTLKLRYEKSLKEEKLNDEVKNNIQKKLIEINTELKKIEKKLYKKKMLNDLAQQTLEVYDKADEWFMKTADLDLVSKDKK